MHRRFILVLGILALAATSRFAAAEDTLKVAIPQKGAWDAGLVELGQRGGIFKKHGLTLDILYTAAGPESIQALIGGSIDVAVASGVSAAIGTFGKGAPIRIISSEMTGAPDLYWYVPADSPIHKIEDFNGKTVSYSAVGSSSHGSLLALIAQYHLTAKPQQTGNIAATITQTMTGQVDVGFGAAPFGLDLVESGKTRIIATGNDVVALRTRAVRVNLTGAQTLAEPARRDRPLHAGLPRDGRLDVFQSGGAEDLRRIFRAAGQYRAAGPQTHSEGSAADRARSKASTTS